MIPQRRNNKNNKQQPLFVFALANYAFERKTITDGTLGVKGGIVMVSCLVSKEGT